jgi:hypothetical protein
MPEHPRWKNMLYDWELRPWAKWETITGHPVSSAWDVMYYNRDLDQYRLAKYLMTPESIDKAVGLALWDSKMEYEHGQITGWYQTGWTPGVWIVLSSGEIEIVPGSVSRRPVRLEPNGS